MRLLRFALTVDAAACGGMGIALAAGSRGLDDLLGIPAGWLIGSGVALTGCAVGIGVLSRASVPPSGPVRAVVAGNLAWVAASVVAVVAGGWELTTAGTVVVLAQAAAVALLADLERRGLRSARRAGRPAGPVSAAGRPRSARSPAPDPR